MDNTNQALERAITVAGGLSALADKIDQKPQTVNNWRSRGVPPERVLDVEKATADENGKPQVSRHELRPDIYPAEAAA